MLSPKIKRNISRILPFGIIWLISGLVFLVVEQGAIDDIEGNFTTRIELNLSVFIFSSLAITCVGFLVGTIELFYLNQVFAKKSFTKKILSKLLVYTLLLFIVTLITYPIAASLELKMSLFDPQVWTKLYDFLASYAYLSTGLQLLVALGISLFYAEISENIGHGILLNFFTGKYHSPTEEERVFMFLDMKSSTTIAEELGHIRYFELLKEYYADLSDAIIQYAGEIYQYVGDEIIVSWKDDKGIQGNNCIKCFEAMKADLHHRASWYEEKFGVEPTFKAGFHIGKVTTGEIGVLKKEIIFTGDVLNTTARIQGLCNTYGVDMLISEDLINHLDLGPSYEKQSFGQNELRGRKKNMTLYTLHLSDG